jgi:pyruvate/2-oxoglutarate dehydrogenase complex dihydrolipoamide dehydrogenase (E3) component
MPATFDALVIGTGQAGPALAARLSGAGMKVAVVEKHKFGGTCVNNGCTPTKAMVASAYAAHVARRAREYGVLVQGEPQVDMKRVKARKDEIVRNSSAGVEKWVDGLKGAKVYRGHARFTGKNAVQVGGEQLAAGKIFVNVGGRPLIPKMAGLDTVPCLTNETIMDVDFVPPHLVVVGGSYVGLEFAQMFRRFGSRVTVVEMGPRLVAREDEDVSLEIQRFLAAEGIQLRLHAECISMQKEPEGLSVGLDCSEHPRREPGTHLLLAVGRVPNTDDLGLDLAGIKTDRRGYIEVDEGLRTSNPNVWALGDCNGKGAFTHTSYNDYEIVADNLLNGEKRSVRDRITAYGLFIDPPLGRAGMTETEIRKSGRKALVGKRPMTRVGRAVEKGDTRGFMKVAVDADTKEILGAAILGVGGDEAVHSVLDVMYAKAPYITLQRSVHIHPTVSELLPTVLGELKPLA